jgi:glycosyltransferase involved in cell wall biosynthesis
MTKVSVITPFHNDHDWLGRAIQSVLDQSLADFELLLVNDGSIDDSLAIARSYADHDPRIVVVDQEHAGSGAARNAGLRRMTGEYVVFLDADDTLEPRALERMANAMEGHDLDHVIGGNHIVMTTDTTRMVVDSEIFGAPARDYLFRMRDLEQAGEFLIATCGTLFYCIWGRMYKASIIRDFNLRFKVDSPVMEDVNWTFCYYYYCDRCMALKDMTYNYYREADKDDAGYHKFIDQFLCFDAPLQSFQRMVYKFGYSERYQQIMNVRLSEQLLNYTSKVFNDNAGLSEEQRCEHVSRLVDTYVWRWHCHHLASESEFWRSELELLDSGEYEIQYQLLKQKMADEGLPYTGSGNIR